MSSQKPTIMVVDDELSIRESFGLILEDKYRVIPCASGEAGLKKLVDEKIDLIYLDVKMPGMNGMETLKRIKMIDKDVSVVMVTAVNDVQNAGEAIKLGALDYVVKPFDVENIVSMTSRSLNKKELSAQAKEMRRASLGSEVLELIGSSKEIDAVRKVIDDIAEREINVLISGERGLEKALVAKILHKQGQRSVKPFIAFTVEEDSEDRLRARLLGSGKGTFALTLEKEKGLLEIAAGGTLLLENIENLPRLIQKELADTLKKKAISREGSSSSIPIDIRLFCATNIDLKEASEAGAFSRELYEAIAEAQVEMPPLRKRSSDIELMTERLIERYNKIYGKSVKGLSADATEAMAGYAFPGNTDELDRALENIVLSSDKPNITCEDLPVHILVNSKTLKSTGEGRELGLSSVYEEIEKRYVRRVMESVSNDSHKASAVLGLNPQAFSAKLESLGLRQ